MYEYFNLLDTSFLGTPLREGFEFSTYDDIVNLQTQLATYNQLKTVNDPTSIYNNHIATTSAIEIDPTKQSLEDVIVSDQNAIIQQKDAINMVAIVTGISIIILSVMVLGNHK